MVIGVTGTNGKSTVVELIHAILAEAGFKTGSVSSLRFKLGNEEQQNRLKMTMPGRFALQKFLRECVNAGCRYAVLEVTSEGIKQFRNKFIKFDVAVMTNVTPEHIESHGSFENYLEAKLKLFEQVCFAHRGQTQTKHGQSQKYGLGISAVNGDDPNAQKFLQFPAKEKYVYNSAFIGVEKNGSAQKMPITEKLTTPEGISFKLQNTTISSHLLGEFNFYNILAAISAALSQKIAIETIKNALAKIHGIPGRLEFVQKKPFAVVVDYAHTPDALRKVYETLRNANPKSQNSPPRRIPGLRPSEANTFASDPNPKLICVLGAAGGGRDKWKRPEMGKIAAEFCDEVILTNEDPYDESPLEIIKDIEKGLSSKSQIPKFAFSANSGASPVESQIVGFQPKSQIVLDRREAIREAIKSAKNGDTVIITGKGAEPYIMGPNNTKIPWDDRKVAKQELKNTAQ